MCVILTRAGICSLFEPELHHCRPAGGNQRCQERSALPHEHPNDEGNDALMGVAVGCPVGHRYPRLCHGGLSHRAHHV